MLSTFLGFNAFKDIINLGKFVFCISPVNVMMPSLTSAFTVPKSFTASATAEIKAASALTSTGATTTGAATVPLLTTDFTPFTALQLFLQQFLLFHL